MLDADLYYDVYYDGEYFDFSKGLYYFEDNMENDAYYFVVAYGKNQYGIVYGDKVRFLYDYY